MEMRTSHLPRTIWSDDINDAKQCYGMAKSRLKRLVKSFIDHDFQDRLFIKIGGVFSSTIKFSHVELNTLKLNRLYLSI